jgi:two-component system, cell cycle sensor histidine kinase and response regulator CckA
MPRLAVALITVVVVALAPLRPAFADVQAPLAPAVLIINSYNPGHIWTENELGGELAVFGVALPEADVMVEYLDWKRYPTRENADSLERTLAWKLHDRRLSVVVVNDNGALDFALARRERLFSGVPIVFAGINGFADIEHTLPLDTTGIAETVDAEATLSLALRLHPWVDRILVVIEDTESGLGARKEIEAALPKLKRQVRLEFTHKMSLPEVLERIRLIGDDTGTIVYTTWFTRDPDGRTYRQDESAELLGKASRVPVYASHEWSIGRGTVGGYILRGRDQGTRAAEMAARIVRGTPASQIPRIAVSPTMPTFDYRQLARFGLSASDLPEGSIVLYRPDTLYARYRTFIWTAATAIVVLGVLNAILFRNIIRRRRAEQALRASEEKHRALIETTQTAYVIIDTGGRVLDANAEYARVTGRSSAADVVGRSILEWTAPHDVERNGEALRKCLATGSVRNLEVDYITPSGKLTPVEINATMLHESGRVTVLSLCWDITSRRHAEKERERLEARLLEAHRLESIGRLAGGVAHDFNNLLTIISGYSAVLKRRSIGSPELSTIADEIGQASSRGADLTSQLLAFGRRQILAPKALDLNQVLTETSRMLKPLIGEHVAIDIVVADEPALIRFDPGQLSQVIINLAANARDAMPEGGKLLLQSSCEDLPGGSDLSPGSYVVLTVRDTGTGMDAETKGRLFEPFFTTKRLGKGTGLGLATVHGIVSQSGGAIRVDSSPARGTTFRIFLPRSDVAGSAGDRPAAEGRSGGEETVILVEDEPGVLAVIKSALASYGYRPLAAGTPEAGLELVSHHKWTARLLITDLVMPGMNGQELVSKAKQIAPELRFIYMSGYADDAIIERAGIEHGAAFLQKPFTPEQLNEKIRSVLAGD